MPEKINCCCIVLDSPRELSWAQEASAAAKRVMRFLSELSTNRASRRHITSSTDGCERMARSEPSSWGPAYVTMGYTVNLQPQPFTEPSLVNFQRNSSPVNQKKIMNQVLQLWRIGCKKWIFDYNGTTLPFNKLIK